jgi:SAM-dependent methyltransferase
MSRLSERTIRDFGQQWTRYQDNSGFYGSRALFEDIFSPLLTVADLDGKRVADVGAGTGRFVNVLLDAGASHVVAVEPSDAFRVLKKNTESRAARITYLHATGDQLPAGLELDLVLSIGVLHHIPDPRPVVVAARRALKDGAQMGAWLYGREGNRPYLFILSILRALTRPLPDSALVAMAWMLYWPLRGYMAVAAYLPVPLGNYLTRVVGRLSADKIHLVIYDQLRPAYAKYYTRDEAKALFEDAGYTDVTLHHRHGYSWAVLARNSIGGAAR